MELPLAAIERIMRNAGAERMTEDAVLALQESAQGLVDEMVRDAVAVAEEDGRARITRGDIRDAIER